MNNDDGEPAFPITREDHRAWGISMRDYFAAKFIAGRSAIPGDVDAQYDAALAYKVADAMIAERAK